MMWILLFFSLTSSVWTFVEESVYKAEEDGNVTFIWDSEKQIDLSLSTVICVLQSKPPKFLFVMIKGVETSKSQHQQFAGRVQSDKDALRGGRVELQLFRLTAEDSGNYICDLTAYDGSLVIWKLQTSVTFTVTSHTESSIYVSPSAPKYEAELSKGANKQRQRPWDVMVAYAQAVIIKADKRRCYR